MASILLSLNQTPISTPYTFAKSHTKIYSLEEALFYTYANWQERDFTTPAFIAWVDTILGLSDISSKLQELNKVDSYTQKLMTFLSITPYFDSQKLAAIKAEVESWEEKSSVVLLKEEADTQVLVAPKKATELYSRAVAQGGDAATYNNMAISYMNRNMYKEAAQAFGNAYSLDKNNLDIILNYSLALIEMGEIEQAFRYIRRAESFGESAYVYFLYAKICHANKNIKQAVEYLNQALDMEKNCEYYYYLAKVYALDNRHADALETINKVQGKDQKYYIKLAELFALGEDYPKAIQAMEDAHRNGTKTAATLATLASYQRQNNDLTVAQTTIEEALKLEQNKFAMLEDAKIKKSQGKLRDYQKIMENILREAKENYRKKL
ncbi:MAG: hypothetical protein FWG63_10685 [Defluviitaleaceae bacterium]|nr:hypothetical protein [Defluviitaleaceae bacterium]